MSETFTAVVLPSVEEQMAAGDELVIDPADVSLEEWEGEVPSPVFRNGSYAVEDIIGIWKNPRVEDGRLVVDIRLQERYEPLREAARFSFAGIHGGGVARMIAVDAHWKQPPAEEA